MTIQQFTRIGFGFKFTFFPVVSAVSLVVAPALIWAHPGHDSEESGVNEAPFWESVIQPYEPIHLGYTFDEGDQAYLDFSLSIMTPISVVFPTESWNPRAKIPGGQRAYTTEDMIDPRLPRVYFAFSGRAGQYIGTRDSSPVVGKRFNPLLSFRWWQKQRDLEAANGLGDWSFYDYFEVSFGHESNGQRIGDIDNPQTPEQENLGRNRFRALQDEYLLIDGDASIARDELSRGWDYLGARLARSWRIREHRTLFLQFDGRYYFSNSPVQGEAEEYNLWEGDDEWLARYDGEITRSKVDGLRASVRFEFETGNRFLNVNEVRLDLATGYKDPFERVTARLELGFRYTTLWYRNGYNSDLVDYYRKDESWGLALKIREF